MIKEIDCRGLACPAPVLRTKETLEGENPSIIKVVVDNEAAKQNVTRFMKSQGLEVSVEEAGDNFHVTGKVGEGAAPETPPEKDRETGQKKIMVMVANDKCNFATILSKVIECGEKGFMCIINPL